MTYLPDDGEPREWSWSVDHFCLVTSIIVTRRPRRVLEWGSGISTMIFNRGMLFVERMFEMTWLAIDHDPAHASAWATIRENEAGYVGAVAIGPPPDLVIVDGNWRHACLMAAAKHLAPGGLVLLHDAERPEYRAAVEQHYREILRSREIDGPREMAVLEPRRV